MTVMVKDYWKSHISAVIYGYCVCGREVQHSAKKIDEKCPLCGDTLEWDLSDKYDTDILKTLNSIDASLKSIAKSVQPVNTTVVIDNNSEEAVKEFLNSLHRKNVQQEDAEC